MKKPDLEVLIIELLQPYSAKNFPIGRSAFSGVDYEQLDALYAALRVYSKKKYCGHKKRPKLSIKSMKYAATVRNPYRLAMVKYIDARCGFKFKHPAGTGIPVLEATANYLERHKYEKMRIAV